MEPDFRAMLLAVVARIEQLIVQVEAILLEASGTETVDRMSMQLAERRRVLADMEEKLKQSHQIGGLNRDRRSQSTKGATGSRGPRTRTRRAFVKSKTIGESTSLNSNRILSVVAWRHGASQSIAYWTIRHEPSNFLFARCATRKEAVALAENVYAMFPEEFWKTQDVDVIAETLQPLRDTILKPHGGGHELR